MSARLRLPLCALCAVFLWSAWHAPAASAQYSWAAQMREEIHTLLDTHDSGGTWSVLVVNLETGEPVVAHRSTASMIPASTVKLLTSATALDLLGPSFRYQTALTRTGPVRNGCVEGNLVLQGSGDPSLGETAATDSLFASWATGLKRTGIACVKGAVVGDDTAFDAPSMGPGWSWDDASYGYAAQHSALSYRGNVVDVQVQMPVGAERPEIAWEPDSTAYVTFRSSLAPGAALDRSFRRLPGQNVIEIDGTIPVGRSTQFQVTVHNPTLFAAHAFSTALQQAGLRIESPPATARMLEAPPAVQDTVASVFSPRLAELVREMNTESDNLYAEQLLHTLGARAHGDSLRAESTRGRGLHLVRNLMARAGADPARQRLVDGSGLSRYNLVSAEALVYVLAYMYRHPTPEVRRAFMQSLPVGGRDGTLAYRFRRATAARGNVRAKTGTLSNNSSLAGYVTSFEGTPFAFALMANNHVGSTRPLRRMQDQIVNILAEYPR